MNTQLAFTIIGFHVLVVFLPVSMVVLFKWPQAWHGMLTIFLGALIGYLNLHSDEVQFPVLLLLMFGFFIAFSHPRNAWRTALLLAVWIPAGHFLSNYLQRKSGVAVREGFASFLAFIPAFAGTYMGVVVRLLAERSNPVAKISQQQ